MKKTEWWLEALKIAAEIAIEVLEDRNKEKRRRQRNSRGKRRGYYY